METGTIIITEEDDAPLPQKVAIYARVSSHEMKDNLQRQADRLVDYCAAKGWQVSQVVKEVGSGVNDNRKQFLKLLSDPTITIIVVEHKLIVLRTKTGPPGLDSIIWKPCYHFRTVA